MAERFDSWQRFVDAGFVSAEGGVLRLGNEVALMSATKASDAVRVTFTSGVTGFERISFEMPLVWANFWEWSASLAQQTFGTRLRWMNFCESLGEPLDRELEQLIAICMDHLDSVLPEDESGNRAVEDVTEQGLVTGGDDDGAGDESEDRQVGSLGSEGACVAWDEQLRKIVDAALADEWQKLSDSAQARDLDSSRAVMERVNRLKAIDEKIAALAKEWRALGLKEANDGVMSGWDGTDTSIRPGVEAPDGEVEESDSPARAARRSAPTGPVLPPKPPKPEPKGALGFAVTFADGVRIGESKASATFAKVIEKIGAERVAALGLKMADDPIVTREKSEIRKMPMMVQSIADGWFVKTHSNTYTKMDFLRRIGEALQVELKFETFRHEPLPKRRKPGRPPKPKPCDPQRFQIGRVVKHYFPKVFALGRVTEEEITLFLSDESKRRFGTRGQPVLKVSTGGDGENIINGQRRYYSDLLLEHGGRRYLLTSQFITKDCEPVLAWLESKGFARGEMTKVGKGEEIVPGLFDDITVFASDELAPPSGNLQGLMRKPGSHFCLKPRIDSADEI